MQRESQTVTKSKIKIKEKKKTQGDNPNLLSSSSSSSSNENRQNALLTSNQANQTKQGYVDTLKQTGATETKTYGNIQTGYVDNRFHGSTANTAKTNYSLPPVLGKNLYGETGYVTNMYSLQQPYPGQSVYVQLDPQYISEKTKAKFQNPNQVT